MTPTRRPPLRVVASIVASAATTGCFTDGYNQDRRADLERRVVYELDCSPDQIELTELSRGGSFNAFVTSYGVEGCGRRMVYVLTEAGTWVPTSGGETVSRSTE